MEKYDVTVVEYPAKRLAGLKVKTTMRKANEDCTALWRAFEPRLAELPEGGGERDFYGVSVMLNAEDFDYWAAVETEPAAAAPRGMGVIDLPAGRYAKAAVPNLEKVVEAYMYLYDEWLKGQTAYAAEEASPCFERYPPNWQPTDAFEVFMPVRKL